MTFSDKKCEPNLVKKELTLKEQPINIIQEKGKWSKKETWEKKILTFWSILCKTLIIYNNKYVIHARNILKKIILFFEESSGKGEGG